VADLDDDMGVHSASPNVDVVTWYDNTDGRAISGQNWSDLSSSF